MESTLRFFEKDKRAARRGYEGTRWKRMVGNVTAEVTVIRGVFLVASFSLTPRLESSRIVFCERIGQICVYDNNAYGTSTS